MPVLSAIFLLQITAQIIAFITSAIYIIFALVPIVISQFTNISVKFEGTFLLVIIFIVIHFIKRLESVLLMLHYKGFLR